MASYNPREDFKFMSGDTVQSTPENHPHILDADVEADCANCSQTIDQLRNTFNESIIGSRISFESGTSSGNHQFGQLRFVDDNTISLARTNYEDRRGGVTSACSTPCRKDKGLCSIQGFAKAVLRYLDKNPQS